MDDSKYENAMQIIMHAGTARSCAIKASNAAAKSDFETAERELKEAQNEMHEAHKVQFDLVHAEANGHPVELNIVLVHAQDHLTMAIMSIDFAERMIDVYRRLDALTPSPADKPEQ